MTVYIKFTLGVACTTMVRKLVPQERQMLTTEQVAPEEKLLNRDPS